MKSGRDSGLIAGEGGGSCGTGCEGATGVALSDWELVDEVCLVGMGRGDEPVGCEETGAGAASCCGRDDDSETADWCDAVRIIAGGRPMSVTTWLITSEPMSA